MTNTPTDQTRPAGTRTPESELRHCIQEQSQVFESAVQLIEQLEAAADRREIGNDQSVARLQKSLDQVVVAQQKVATAHEQFRGARGSLTTDLRSTLSRHEELLRTLMTRIDHLQQSFEQCRQELAPQLDTESRRRNMQAAYQKSLRSM